MDDGKGRLVTPVGDSPENEFVYTDSPTARRKSARCAPGPTMDMAITRELFANTIAAAEILKVDDDVHREAEGQARQRSCRTRSARTGSSRSGRRISRTRTRITGTCRTCTRCTRATRSRRTARRSCSRRRSSTLELRGDEATGWSMGWKINFWARLLDGDHAHALIKNLIKPSGTTETTMNRGAGPLPEHVRRASAVPDRRQLRRDRRHRRDAAAKPRGRDRAAAGAAEGVAERDRSRACGHAAGSRSISTWADGKLKEATIKSLAGRPLRIRAPKVTIDGKRHAAGGDGVVEIATRGRQIVPGSGGVMRTAAAWILAARRVSSLRSRPHARAQAARLFNVDYRSLVSRADLRYDTPVERSEEGMPVGNGRMGSLVWTTPNALRFQVNRNDVFATASSTHSFPRAHTDYSGGCAYVDVHVADYGADVFAGKAFRQHLSVYDGVMTAKGNGVTTRVIAWHAHDVFAIEVDDRREQPAPVHVDLRMLRYANQYLRGTHERPRPPARRRRSRPTRTRRRCG